MSKQNESSEQVKINPKEIPKAEMDLACSILNSSVRRFFEQPNVQKEYEEWLKSEDAKRFSEDEKGDD